MHGYQLRIEVVANANNFLAGNRVTFRTAAVGAFRDRFQITLYCLASLEGMCERLPVPFGITVGVGEYLHNITASECGIDRFQTAVDSGILAVVAEFGMHLVGEVNHSGVLRKDYILSLEN